MAMSACQSIVILRKDDQDIEINMEGHDSLLSAIEHAGFSPSFNCRDGFCGTCRQPLIKGKASHPPISIADPESDTEVWLCCASSLTSTLIVNADDIPFNT